MSVCICPCAQTITFITHYSRHKKENQIEEAKKGIKKNTKKQQEGHVTLSTELQSTALMLNFLAASMALEKYFTI